MQKEIWKPVVGYDGRYEVSNTGKIRTNLRINKRILSPAYRENYGHVFVNITVNGIRKKKYIHTAVLEAFVCKRPVGMEVRHLDGNPQNNM